MIPTIIGMVILAAFAALMAELVYHALKSHKDNR